MQDPWQTRASVFHPYVINSLDALPASLRGPARVALPPESRIIGALVVPQDYRAEGESEPVVVPEQALIFTDEGAVHLRATLEGETPRPASVLHPDSLLYMRSSHLLLHGRVEVVYARQSGLDKLDMMFNAIGWRLMGAQWRDLVREVVNCTAQEPTVTPEQTAALLGPVPPKFVDGLQRYALYTGENLRGAVFQPAIWKESLFASEEQVTPNTLLVLTDCSVLALSESGRWSAGASSWALSSPASRGRPLKR
jgi:hypothetical protein